VLMGLYKGEVFQRFNKLSRHFQPHDASKSNERHRYLINKLKCLAVVSSLHVTNKVPIPSYHLQIKFSKRIVIKHTKTID